MTGMLNKLEDWLTRTFPWKAVLVGFGALSVGSFAETGALPTSESPCYRYRLAVVSIVPVGDESQPVAKDFLIQIVDVWKQGDFLRVEDELGNRYYASAKEAVYVNAQGKAWGVRDPKYRSLLTSMQGLHFMVARTVAEPDRMSEWFPKRTSMGRVSVDGTPCDIIRYAVSVPSEDMPDSEDLPDFRFSVTAWVPRDADSAIPTAFFRLNVAFSEIRVEARLLKRESLPEKPTSFFKPDSHIRVSYLEGDELAILGAIAESWKVEP